MWVGNKVEIFGKPGVSVEEAECCSALEDDVIKQVFLTEGSEYGFLYVFLEDMSEVSPGVCAGCFDIFP